MAWISAAQVSHSWRAAAVECPSLWSTIDCRNVSWTQEALRRSKAVPLSLSITKTGAAHKDAEQLAFVRAHAARVADFSSDGFSVNELRPCLAAPWPRLARLRLACPPLSQDATFGPADVGAHMPRLEELELEHCEYVGDESPALGALQQLQIRFDRRGWPKAQVATFLAGTANVREMTLIEPSVGLRTSLNRPPADTTAIELPRLEKLHVYGDAASYGLVLPLIPVPKESLEMHSRSTYDAALQPLLEYSRKFWLETQANGRAYDRVRLSAWQDSVTPSKLMFASSVEVFDAGNSADARLRLVIEDESKACCQRLLRSACQSLPVTRIATVDIRGQVDPTSTLLRMAAVERLTLDSAALGFLALTYNDTFASLAPALNTLTLDCKDSSQVDTRCLTKWLSTRTSRGLNLSQLSMKHVEKEGMDKWMQEVEKHVGQVSLV